MIKAKVKRLPGTAMQRLQGLGNGVATTKGRVGAAGWQFCQRNVALEQIMA
jgi:hypothetical protein